MKNQTYKIENPMAYARTQMRRKAQAQTERSEWNLGNRFDFRLLENRVASIAVGR